MVINDSVYDMGPARLRSIISKFQMPDGEYIVERGDEFGESEFWWVIKNSINDARFLLVNTYSHPSLEKEMAFYRENGFAVKRPVLRKPETLKRPRDKDDPVWKYLLWTYAIFELK
ncbi:hypothetical protein IKZ77_02130 [Candidatus Saccharibacteria bacterium]|nr:hypothetical protein [Candidatus Saccharibacteria bacterium]